MVKGLSLITDHIDFRFDLSLTILIRSKNNSDKVRDIVSGFMGDSELFLEGSRHLNVSLTHHHIVISLSE